MTKRLILPSLLFLSVVVVYLANGRTLGAGETLPARYLPFSLLGDNDYNLDEFPFLYGDDAQRTYPLMDGIPYFLRHRDDHYFSAYSPGPAVLALPVYAGFLLAGASVETWAPFLEKFSAAAITALSVVCLFWVLTDLVSQRWALVIAAIYAFGTSAWSVSSQGLWPHGPSQLFLTLLLICLARGTKDERLLPCAGFVLSAAAVMRATDLLIALPVIAGLLYTHPRLVPRFFLFALPPIGALLLYNVAYLGSPTGTTGNTTAPFWDFFVQTPLLDGLSGLLFSPSRGLFVYSPVLLFSIVGVGWVLRHGPPLLKAPAVGVVLVLLVVSKSFMWWDGHSWGPRLLADTTPLLCFFLYPLPNLLDRNRRLRALFVLLAAVSVATHGLGAFFYDGRWDVLADVGRTDASLWSWRHGPLVFYTRQAASAGRRILLGAIGAYPTSADSPTLLAASYKVGPIASEGAVGDPLLVALDATNTGRAIWLASAGPAMPADPGVVRLGWQWSRDKIDLVGGRVFLSSDVFPGQTERFASRIPPPAAPGDYTLTLGLLSEPVTWFGAQGQPPLRVAVRVRAADLARFLADPVERVATSPTAAISTDRGLYRRTHVLHLTVNLRNPAHPGKFDGYLARRGPDGAVWFYDGHQPPRPAQGAWIPWLRELSLPARTTGRFVLPLSTFAAGAYRWHVVLTESGTYRRLAHATSTFAIEP